MAARDAGLDFLKFFPAEQAGGMPFLKALASPISDVRFCPAGSITASRRPTISRCRMSFVSADHGSRRMRW
jgi:2-keto-3-deoxy-6-phosphogluconate aldolase